ncbi:MAG: hypothetical protein AVDCRST_MAG87-354 [uncultured Thermomicrobiales bacterium]|uniref:Uncharacterized protein n=1 Tax=uncultured Thermomicrobiales bacterium TaxID=1645740 RepID=A0A6J4UAX8_9BACT|nr:MAG: hypothetical protein AVDCRST_MAG87-354 [uncultured Thermomicrobiales bacterium]
MSAREPEPARMACQTGTMRPRRGSHGSNPTLSCPPDRI